MNSDWYNNSENEAILLIFQRGVTCEESRKVCSEFMKECPEGNIQKLADQLKGVKISKKPTSKDNCLNCGKAGHLNANCWGTCQACDQTGHKTGSCQLSVQEKIKREKDRTSLDFNWVTAQLNLLWFSLNFNLNLVEIGLVL